jgi:uncharacterized protein with ParB-like and HNH nuclease domain
MLDELQDEKQIDVWYEAEIDEPSDFQLKEYEITAAPNDFNVVTLFNFIESKAVKIPAFQRNYVWDIRRASKLIESLIIGLPIPQIFLYEEGRNSFLVIDGQQRLMSIYYFIKGRFPRKERRIEIRRIFDEHGTVPSSVLSDDKYFEKFDLSLPSQLPNQSNRLNHLNYETLGDYRMSLDLRAIRNIIIKQNVPEADGSSSMYEIFNRLNSGGVNLMPQEIRASLYHSPFYQLLYKLNSRAEWQKILGVSQPDLHMKDLEVLLRGFAMLIEGKEYSPSMVKFLNNFSRRGKGFSVELVTYLEELFDKFLASASLLPVRPFHGRKTNKFNISTFEAVFAAQLQGAFLAHSLAVPVIEAEALDRLIVDDDFTRASQEKTTSKAHVALRLERARAILFP